MATDLTAGTGFRTRRVQEDPALVRGALIVLAVAVLGLLVVVPLANVFYEALRGGPQAYWDNLINDPDTWSAILLTLRVAPAAVLANSVSQRHG